MKLEKRFEVTRPRHRVVAVLERDETLLDLLPGQTEIIARDGDRRTTSTRYVALGREGEARFHWQLRMDGSLALEKVCDGHVWRTLAGSVTIEEAGAGSLVIIELSGRTKGLIPEFSIKGPMEEQIAQMSTALRELLEGSP